MGESAKASKASKDAKKGKKKDTKKKEWKKPSDAPKKKLTEVSKYLGDLLAKAGPNDDTPSDEYQKKCADKFEQEFDNDAWNEWFDDEIERLEDEADKGKAAKTSKDGKKDTKTKEWKKPSDAPKKE